MNEVKRSRKIFLAHIDSAQRKIIQTILSTLDHKVPVATDSGLELVKTAIEDSPDLIIASPHLADLDGIEALIQIGNVRPIPAILVSRSDDLEKVERAMEDHVMAYLVEPITASMLLPAIYLCERRFAHFRRLEQKIERLQKSLHERKTIERAKLILIQARGLSEPEAHREMQKSATAKRRSLIDIAQSIIEASDLISPQADASNIRNGD